MQISTVNISQRMTDKANMTIAPNIMPHVGFRLSYLELTLTYSKAHLGCRNGINSNILACVILMLAPLVTMICCWKLLLIKISP